MTVAAERDIGGRRGDAPAGHAPAASVVAVAAAVILATAVLVAAVGTVVAGPAGAAAPTGPAVWVPSTVPLTGLDPAAGVSPAVTVAGVSCPTAGTCVAVGRYSDGGGGVHGLIETLAKGTWTAQTAPAGGLAPAATGAVVLTGVACFHPTACTASGWYAGAAGQRVALLEVVDGGPWTAQTPSTAGLDPAATSAQLTTVACSAPAQCGAFGTYTATDGSTRALVLTSDTTGWTAATVSPAGLDPVPAAAPDLRFTASSCPAGNQCEAVGDYLTTTGQRQGLEVLQHHVHVSATTLVRTGLVPGASASGSSGLGGVACPTTAVCVAVGQYAATDGAGWGLATVGGGPEPSGWASSTLSIGGLSPAPTATGGVAMGGVSCWGVGACVGAGTYAATGGGSGFVVSTLSGGTWTSSSAAASGLAGYGPVTVSGISCPAAGSCVIAGSYLDPSGHWRGFVDAQTASRAGAESGGYWEVASDGGIFSFGGAPFLGSTGNLHLNAPIVGMAQDPCTGGYWMAAADGGVFGEGAPYLGSVKARKLSAPVVGIAAYQSTPNRCGYWLVSADGGVFSYHVPFLGSMGGIPLNRPIVGIAADTATGGYWLVASDGGIFAFGAPFLGSMGGIPLNQPVVGIATDPATGGYWEVASDGGLFSFDAPFLGSMGGIPLNRPVVGVATDPVVGGYWEVASDGGIFTFGVPFAGSTGNLTLNQPMVAMASNSPLG